jgi:hypothetical protein
MAALLLGTSLVFAGCKSPVDPTPSVSHEHVYGAAQWSGVVTWGNWKTVTESTDTKDGLGKRTGTEKGTQPCTSGDGAAKDVSREVEDTRAIPAGYVLIEGATWTVAERTQNHEHAYVWQDTGNTHWIAKPTDPNKEIEEKEQQHICLADGTVDGTQWVATGNERTKDQNHEHEYIWQDTLNTRWTDKPGDSTKEIEERQQQHICTADGTVDDTRWVATGAERSKEQNHEHAYTWQDTAERRWIDKSGDSTKEIEQKKQNYICLDDNTISDTRWTATGAERSKEQNHEHAYTWQDTGNTHWITKQTDPNKEIEEKEQQYICLADGTVNGTQWVATGNERDKQQEVTVTLPSGLSNPVNVDIANILSAVKVGGGVHGINAACTSIEIT